MITDEQARVIYDLRAERGIQDEWFNPFKIYLSRLDEPALRALEGLSDAGLIKQKGDEYRLTSLTLKAYDEWAQRKQCKKLRHVHFRSCLGGICSVVIVISGPFEELKLKRILSSDPDFMGISGV